MLRRKWFGKQLQSFARKFSLALGMRVSAALLGFAGSIVLARMLGVEGFGVYTFAFAWTRFLQIPATFGTDNLLVKEISIYLSRSHWGLMRGLISWSNCMVLLSSAVSALIAVGAGVALGSFQGDPEKLWTFILAMMLLPILSVRNLFIKNMQGLGKGVLGLLPELILTPILTILLTISAYLLLGKSLNPVWAMGARILATTVTLYVAARVFNSNLPIAVKEAAPEYMIKTWVCSAVPLALIGSMFIINSQADLIMLGAMQGTDAVGLYFPAVRGAQLISFLTVSGNLILAPVIASHYASGDKVRLKQIIFKNTWAVFVAALVATVLFIALGRQYLSFYGVEFTSSYGALLVLCCGQMFNAATCSVAYLLIMTNHEKQAFVNDSLGAATNIILNACLIPYWSIEGAAAASTISSVVVNIMNAHTAWTKLGINGTILRKS